MAPPLLALTMGEPGGIAGEITLAAWKMLRDRDEAQFFIIGDPKHLGGKAAIATINSPQEARTVFKSGLPVLEHRLDHEVTIGVADPANAQSVLSSIKKAVDFALTGEVGGIVTNPIQKESLYSQGFAFQGHTDFLADLARKAGYEANPVMMLSAKDLRTVPITVHIALKDVPDALSRALIISQTETTVEGLSRWFGLGRPRVGITGLNPHAGEGGAMGSEEIEFISPAIADLQAKGIDATGPLPADTVFHEEARCQYDVIMCMYHDQALIPVKTLGFHDGVNTTLGLPFVRTSPDHGTALSLAGKGIANPSSLIAAIRQAASMANNDAGAPKVLK